MHQESIGTLESLEDFRHFSEQELEGRFEQLKKQIVPADKTIREQAEKHWGHVAKPLGSLGVLEEDIVRAAAAQGEEVPDFSKRALLIFCADNGVVEEGVSQTGQEVTAAVVSNMTRGRSCSCLMAEKAEADVFPIDMGIACEVEHRGELYPLTERKIRRGTSNFTKAAAMTRQEVLTAILTGIDEVHVLKEHRQYDDQQCGRIGSAAKGSRTCHWSWGGFRFGWIETENGGNPAWNRTASPGSHGWHGGIAKGRRIRSGGDGRCFFGRCHLSCSGCD